MMSATSIRVRPALWSLAAGLALAACAVDGTVTQQRTVTIEGMDAASAAPVGPGPVGHGKEAFMASYDANEDGAVSETEFASVRRAGYDRRDDDGDGAVSSAEYVAEFTLRFVPEDREDYQRQMRQTRSRFDVLDDDGDGSLSWEEFADSGEFMFTSLDSNGDGRVDAADDAESY